MAAKKKPNVALLVQTENVYDIRRIVGRFVVPQEDGDLYGISWQSRFGDSEGIAHLADLEITAYVGDRDNFGPYKNGRVWGLGHSYGPNRIDSTEHARAIAHTLGKIERGLRDLNGSAGYLAEGDYHGYALRIAGILRVPTMYVRNFRRAQEMSGDRYHKVDGSGLQSYVHSVEHFAERKEYAQLNER